MAEANWLPALFGAIGAIVGASGAVFTGIMAMKNQVKLEELKWSRSSEVENEKQKQELIDARLRVYNRILKADGEIRLVTFAPGYKYPEQFDYIRYAGALREIVYEDYHLLDPKIREIVKQIDDCMEEYYFTRDLAEPTEFINHGRVIKLYLSLIKKIRDYYELVKY